MSDQVAFFLTWTTYGTWLPGDERGWAKCGEGIQLPDPATRLSAISKMTEQVCTLDQGQRELVENTVRDHCRIRGWHLHAVNCRSNHVHVVVSADLNPESVRDQFKTWCTRKLKERLAYGGQEGVREKWWTEGGSQRYINTEDSLEAAITFVAEAQERKKRDCSS